MRILQGPAAARYVRKLERRGQTTGAFEPQVRRIVDDVKRNGDRALRKYAERWDGLRPGASLRVSASEMQSALDGCPRELEMPSRKRRLTFAASANSRCRSNGSTKSTVEPWLRSCVRSVPRGATCPGDAIPCRRPY